MIAKPTSQLTKSTNSIENLPPFIIGGAVFNHQYSKNPESLPIESILKKAFSSGFNAIDTSPYYGPSEELLGSALKNLSTEFPRDSYFICTKVGRIKLNEFDYSPSNVKFSVERSLKRLNTNYLDVVYMHDIEFQSSEQILEALKELKKFKEKGVIRNIGISGYPVKFLYEIAIMWKDKTGEPLDIVLSYCNGCLQNNILFEFYDKFKNEAGIKQILNGSILSMSLLRSEPPHSFHPGSNELKQKVQELYTDLKIDLAELSTKYAINEWLIKYKSPIVLGVSSIKELDVAIDSLRSLEETGLSESDANLIKTFQKGLCDHCNETWVSGNH
ncbi:uncharacterized protein KGF55_005370 [Candida pseudojiufengensis]|uniref:uncharacterized protein n=1 Tax=Candida pseudojiufengensis TaxID=497109 RepID=UPI002224497E|nr:uncharacterized protein KGF55_005370 [Candida pseudojiufengensis]KAI5959393.1 hypothetical protein KGF55_005370 [Candida pseudojiufengensis]